jgi:hypothetical protein
MFKKTAFSGSHFHGTREDNPGEKMISLLNDLSSKYQNHCKIR